MLERICSLQHQYGKTEKELETMADGYLWALNDYKLPEIGKAFQEYILKHNDIPTAFDIITIIKTKKPEIESKWLQETRKEQENKTERAGAKARNCVELKMFQIKSEIETWPESVKFLMWTYIMETAYYLALKQENIRNSGYSLPFPQMNEDQIIWWKEMCSSTNAIDVEIPWNWFKPLVH